MTFYFFFISFIFISLKIIILQYCSGFCHFNYNVFWDGSLNCLFLWHVFISFQPLTHVWLFVAPILQHQASLSITSSQNLLKLMSTKLVMPSHPLSSTCPAFNLSRVRVCSSESVLHIRWPNYWISASASVLPMNIQHWFILGLTGWITCQSKDSQESSLKPQFKASIFRCSACFIVQLSHTYMTTGKTITLTR